MKAIVNAISGRAWEIFGGLVNSKMLFACQYCKFQPARHSKLSVNIAEMALDRLFTDRKFACNLTVAAALFDCRDNFDFARCQTETASRGLPRARPRSHRFASHPKL